MVEESTKLPIFSVADGTEILDHNGNIWQFNLEQEEWIYRGRIQEPSIVSEVDEGIITPEIYRKLILIQELIENGYDFSAFKLKTDAGTPYFYYFYSSDNFIQFAPAGVDKLQIDLDSGRLYKRLMRSVCIGPKGLTGPQGDAGINGRAALNEIFNNPIVENNNIIINKVINIPIDTPISVRLFNDDLVEIVEVVVPLNNTESATLIINDSTIDAEIVEAFFDSITNKITVELSVISNDNLETWQYKARQLGKKGKTGKDGNDFIELEQRLLDDPALKSTEAVVSLRRSGPSNVSVLAKRVFSSLSASTLAPASTTFPPTDVSKAVFTSVEITTKESKLIGFYNFVEPNIEIPELDLPSWTPVDGCGQHSRWANFKYNWWDNTSIKFGFNIIPTPKPPESCCEAEFFWCPNVGDEPCGIVGSNGDAPDIKLPKKFAGDHICGCDNPIEFELVSGGYVFSPIDTTTSEYNQKGYTAGVITSVWDGSIDRYFIDVKISGKTRIEMQVIDEPTACGSDNLVLASSIHDQARDPAFRPINKCHISGVIEDLIGNAKWISPTVVETEKFPTTIGFDVDTNDISDSEKTETNVRVSLSFNNTSIDNCRGYKIIALVKKILD